MGRLPWSDRTVTEECRILSIFSMSRAGVFEKGPGNYWVLRCTNRWGEETASVGYWLKKTPEGILYIQMSYSITNRFSIEKEDYDYAIGFTTTPCNFGGVRYWFICPLAVDGKPCRRRVAKLYLPPGSKYFGCRHCYNLTYKSRKEHDKRLDAVMKNPELLKSLLESGDAGGLLLGIKACEKMMGRRRW